jgi:hypothetical protein
MIPTGGKNFSSFEDDMIEIACPKREASAGS